MRTKVTAAVGISLLLLMAGCEDQEPQQQVTKPVNVSLETVAIESRENILEYVGFVSAESVIRYSFKVDGKIDEILVENGEEILPGQPLARLDDIDFHYDLDNAQLIHSQALNARNESKSYLEKLEQAFKQGGISLTDIERARLDYKVKEDEERQAAINLEMKKRQINQTLLVSDVAGMVIDTPMKEGEIVAAGTPVAIIAMAEARVKIGVAPGDISFLSVGKDVAILYEGTEFPAKIRTLKAFPDDQTNTYTVQVALLPTETTTPPLGALVKVHISKGVDEGIFIPINIINNDGEDFIYVAQNGRAQKTNVELGRISKGDVQIYGLDPGAKIIVKGHEGVRDGSLIQEITIGDNS